MLDIESEEDEVTLSDNVSFPPEHCEIVRPFGNQLLEKSEWYAHEHFGLWPHKGSALSLGESNDLKYGVTYPLRTGMENPDDTAFPEFVRYMQCDNNSGGEEEEGDEDKGAVGSSSSTSELRTERIEEIYVCHGVCVVSEGPIGGPSKIKGILRPLDSYGTGARVKDVVKTKFSQDINEGSTAKDTYFCLVENGGISLYAEGKSESHVSYMAEFQIEEIRATPFGLIVMPEKQVPDEINDNNDSRFLYALTHPAKQVSRIWLKAPGNDFIEFDACNEKLLWCERDICVFWDLCNRGFSVKTIRHLRKQDIANSTSLNASIYYTNLEHSGSPFSPAGGSAMYSPCGRISQKNSFTKLYHREGLSREGNSLNYWPSFSFDYSGISGSSGGAHGHGFGIGFYPPHYCVYDDPEFYLCPLFQFYKFDGFGAEPRKFQVVSNLKENCEKVAVILLVKTTLLLYAMDIDRGEKIQSYAIKHIVDFVCSQSQSGVYLLTMLTSNNVLKVGFLDRNFKINISAILPHTIERPISTLDSFLHGDTLVCGFQDTVEKGVIHLKNWNTAFNADTVKPKTATLNWPKPFPIEFPAGISNSAMMADKIFLPASPEINSEEPEKIRYTPNEKDGDEHLDWTNHVLNQQIFPDDRRLEEVCRLLDSASSLVIDIEQKAEMSDHDFLEDQEKHLLQIMQVTLSAPVGRAAFTLRTEIKLFANLTNAIGIPRLCLSGKCSKKGTNIEINDGDMTSSLWPLFHNAVAATVAVRFSDQPAEAWFSYNKAKTPEGAEQAGMILGFGLNGILLSMPATLQHDYLSKESSYMSMAMLLGMSINKAGTGDIATWKVISLHIGAMLPACTTELEIPKMASLVAPCALGILFLGTHHNHIAKVLLGEISKRYSPLSLFGGGGGNNSATTTTTADPNGSITDREAHSLCAGFGLGFVNLAKGRLKNGSMDEDGLDGILRRFVVGGPKPQSRTQEEEDMNMLGPALPSLWEEYRCCHIEEGDSVNVDVATPSAIVAVALTYLKSGNYAVLKWLSPPTTLQMLDCVRPDILMLRSLAYILVLQEIPETSVQWLENNLIPRALIHNALVPAHKELFNRIDHESINQSWASIVCGYCLGLGIRFAGTSFSDVEKTMWHYINLMLKIAFPDANINAYFPKNFLESILCSMLISLALVLAGTGDVAVLKLCRYMQHKISGMAVSASNNSYGLEMCTSMAIGILFLGGGRYSLCNDDRSMAVILASVFPKWPINANDNRYHLQALRHLYIMACQPRLLLPKPMPHGKTLNFEVEFLNGQVITLKAPVLLPPFDLLARITLIDKEYIPVEFVLPRDLDHLKKVVANNGIISVVLKPLSAVKYNFLKQMAWRESRESSVLQNLTEDGFHIFYGYVFRRQSPNSS